MSLIKNRFIVKSLQISFANNGNKFSVNLELSVRQEQKYGKKNTVYKRQFYKN